MNIDKIYHLIAGVLVYLFGTLYSPLIGLMLVVIAGIAKEIWDSFGNGTPDGSDAIATIVGGLLTYSIGIEYVKFIG